MGAPESEVVSRIVARRGQYRRLAREVRWLRRFAVLLALADVGMLGLLLWRLRWETFGG